MNVEYFHPQNPKPNHTLYIQALFRLNADHTYQSSHAAEEPDKLIFVYTDRGQGQLQCGDSKFILEERTAFVFSANAPFQYQTAKDRWDFWWFEFFGDCPCPKGVMYQIQDTDLADTLCQKAMASIRSDSASAASYFSCLLTSVAEFSANAGVFDQDIFYRAQTLIKENLYHMNISEMAQILSLSPRTLHKLFHQYVKCSPKTYLQNFVIDKAKYLLANTIKSIAEISDELGFSNQFYFSRVFKEKTGMPPNLYRRKCRPN